MPSIVIPFGPQHPVLPEPIHLKLTVDNEVITEAIPALGYVHRGLEKLTAIRDFNHAMCYCHGLEAMMGIEVPPRAKYLRVIWSELHRLHSHLLWLGLFADSFGFENLFMQFWKIREKILDIDEATTGNRVIVSVNVVGGVRRDLTTEQTNWILAELKELEKELNLLKPTVFDDYTVKKRTVGKGVVSKSLAYELGLAGPTLRASGVAQDMRSLGYAAFNELDFQPVVETDGDCYARTKVRFRETLQSIDLIRQAISKLPQGEIFSKFKGKPEGEQVSRVEQPRGELLYYLKGNGTKNLERVRIRTPTFANLPALLIMLPGMRLADVPVIILSIDPCISCTER
jgi:ech hydrogenase subunit E